MQTASPVRLGIPANLTDFVGSRAGRVALAISANALLAVCARATVPLFFTPVPLTLQTFGVIVTGLLLGPSLAFSTAMLYLLEGAAGLPVFSPAGPGGLVQLFGVTGGFLISYPLSAAAAGLVARASGRFSRFGAALLAGTVATLITLVSGVLWIAHLTHSSAQATAFGVAPFLPGEVIKVIAAAAIYTSTRRYLAPVDINRV